MLFDLPPDDDLYAALLTRDARFDGRAFVCVSSTGIFCRLTCPARKPKRENCTFHADVGACLAAGFRACKRCHPVRPSAMEDRTVATLLEALEKEPGRRWTEGEVQAAGYDPSTVRRAFKREFGLTFLDLARQRRLGSGFAALGAGERVIEAQLDAGFDSPSAFRAAFARLLGCPPGALRRDARLRADWIATPLGDMIAVASATHLHLLEFVDRKALPTELATLYREAGGDLGIGSLPTTERTRAALNAYFEGADAALDVPIAQGGSGFARAVWAALRDIPAGETRSYSDIARAIGRPSATRAVARANGVNRIALIVPCHRVIGADGSLTGYGGGLWRKQRLLEIERSHARSGHDTNGKLAAFRRLHLPGDPLVFWNVWDAGGARAVAEASARLIETGAVGLNLEDQVIGAGTLCAPEEQAARIAAAKSAGEIFVNARTDLYFQAAPEADPARLVEDVLRRAASVGVTPENRP